MDEPLVDRLEGPARTVGVGDPEIAAHDWAIESIWHSSFVDEPRAPRRRSRPGDTSGRPRTLFSMAARRPSARFEAGGRPL